jgi:hypothetical protein
LAELLNIPHEAPPANINLLDLVAMPPQQNNSNVRATVIDGPVALGNQQAQPSAFVNMQ